MSEQEQRAATVPHAERTAAELSYNPHEYPGWIINPGEDGRWYAVRRAELTEKQRAHGCKEQVEAVTYERLVVPIVAQNVIGTWYE